MADISVPRGLLASDPVEVNPFPPDDPKHDVWHQATRTAEKEVSAANAANLQRPLEPTSDFVATSVGIATSQFDAWAKRTLLIVETDDDLQIYDNWLVSYAESLLNDYATRVSTPAAEVRERLLVDLRRALVGRVERWRAAARTQLEDAPQPARLVDAAQSGMPRRLVRLLELRKQITPQMQQKDVTELLRRAMGVKLRDAQAYATLIRPDLDAARDGRAKWRERPRGLEEK